MPDNRLSADGTRVLADLNALRAIGAYKTGVHKPTFSEPHVRSLQWLAQKLPEAGLAAEIDGIGNVLGTSTKAGAKLLAGSHLESQNYAGWLDGPLGVIYALEAARVLNSDPAIKGAVEVASWCDEEGHFGSFLGSRSYVGTVNEAEIDAARDRNADRSMRQALQSSGLAGRPGRGRGDHGPCPRARRRVRHRQRVLRRRQRPRHDPVVVLGAIAGSDHRRSQSAGYGPERDGSGAIASGVRSRVTGLPGNAASGTVAASV